MAQSFADASLSYANIADRYIHHVIDHSVRYVAGKVHINGLENFWSLVKRIDAFVDLATETTRKISALNFEPESNKLSFEAWMTRNGFVDKVPFELRCRILREIIGNPYLGMSKEIVKYTKSPEFVVSANPQWLTWNNSTVPNLIHAMMNKECQECEGGISSNLDSDGCCFKCDAQGHIPHAEPQWDMMPIIADALEEAGCREAAILDHLRGAEPCPHCEGNEGWSVDSGGVTPWGDSIEIWDTCSKCNGTGNRPVQHVRGCWAVELLSGGMQ